MLAVSIAACKAGAAEKEVSLIFFIWALGENCCDDNTNSYSCLPISVQVPLYKHIADLVGKSATTLPVPAITVINGGTHAGNNLPIQVFPLHI